MDIGEIDKSRPWLAVGDEVAELLRQIDKGEFENILAQLRNPARPWFFCGQGRSGLVAAMVAMRFMHLGRAVHYQGEATAPAIRRNDGMLIVSGSGTTPVSLHFAKIAKQESAALIAVTHESDSPLAELADAVLTIPVRGSIQFGGSLFEQTALLALDAAVLAIGVESRIAHESMRRLHTNLK